MDTHAAITQPPSGDVGRNSAQQPSGTTFQSNRAVGVRQQIDALVDASWGFSALSAALELNLLTALEPGRTATDVALSIGVDEQLTIGLLDVLVSLGLVRHEASRYACAPDLAALLNAVPREDMLARLRSAQLQGHALVDAARHGTLRPGWTSSDPELLQAQGRSGRASVHAMTKFFPPELVEALSSPGGAFLDVGMGVGIICIEMCRIFPQLHAVGLEPGAVQAEEAQHNIAAAGFEDRVEVRTQRLEELNDSRAYDFAYLAQVFMPLDVVQPGLRSIRAALRPGGWMSMVAFDAPGDDLRATTARLLNVLWGGTPMPLDKALDLLRQAGFEMVQSGGEPGSLVKGVVGRRPMHDHG
jgi:2-polyprenyl-3-methyl-5-hydroxy-6-metoxy-1,4-benzoquinol methylase